MRILLLKRSLFGKGCGLPNRVVIILELVFFIPFLPEVVVRLLLVGMGG